MNSSWAIFILLLLVLEEGAEVNLPCFSWKTLVLQNVLANNLHFEDKKNQSFINVSHITPGKNNVTLGVIAT